MVFNLLPIPPLDGFNIVTELFDLRKYDWWHIVYNNGFVILMALIFFNFTDRIMTPMLEFFGLGLGQVAGAESGEDDAGLVLGQAPALDDVAQKTAGVIEDRKSVV